MFSPDSPELAYNTPAQPLARRPVAHQPGSVVAIGDVHGCASLLQQELEQHRGSGADLILVGDLIDRSPEADGDRRVLELIWSVQQNPARWGLGTVHVLRGNHEQMLLDALVEEQPGEALELWEWNGGNPELLPLAAEHRSWFEQLPVAVVCGHYLFVHAGVRPGVALDQQNREDLIWIREPFLSQHHSLPFTVVHGHSITSDYRIDDQGHRINLDTGAYLSGVLSSIRLNPEPRTRSNP